MKRIFVVCVVLVLSASMASAGNEWDGNFLINQCSPMLKVIDSSNEANLLNNILERLSQTERIGVMACAAYIQGMVDYNQTLSKGNQLCCLPDGGTYGQYYRVVIKYLQDNPQKLHEPRKSLVIKALQQAFPCH